MCTVRNCMGAGPMWPPLWSPRVKSICVAAPWEAGRGGRRRARRRHGQVPGRRRRPARLGRPAIGGWWARRGRHLGVTPLVSREGMAGALWRRFATTRWRSAGRARPGERVPTGGGEMEGGGACVGDGGARHTSTACRALHSTVPTVDSLHWGGGFGLGQQWNMTKGLECSGGCGERCHFGGAPS